MKRRIQGSVDWKADKWLAGSIIVLWSLGRIINPLLRTSENASYSLGSVLAISTLCYAVLHAAIFIYTSTLLARSVARNGVLPRGKALWELLLYVYVLLALAISLYFIAFEFGYVPAFLGNLLL